MRKTIILAIATEILAVVTVAVCLMRVDAAPSSQQTSPATAQQVQTAITQPVKIFDAI